DNLATSFLDRPSTLPSTIHSPHSARRRPPDADPLPYPPSPPLRIGSHLRAPSARTRSLPTRFDFPSTSPGDPFVPHTPALLLLSISPGLHFGITALLLHRYIDPARIAPPSAPHLPSSPVIHTFLRCRALLSLLPTPDHPIAPPHTLAHSLL